MDDAYGYILQSRQMDYRFTATIQGLGRTPFGKDDSKALKDLASTIYDFVDSLTDRTLGAPEKIRQAVGSGEKRPFVPGGPLDKETYDRIQAGTTKVILGPGESKTWDMFADANFIKE